MVFIALLVAASMTLSSRTVRTMLPFESLLALVTCGVLAVLLFQLDRLA